MRYKEAVTEARQLVKRSETDQWRLAELTYQQVKVNGVTTRQWAEDVGMSKDTASRWARVWEVYHSDTQRPAFADALAVVMGLPESRSERRLMEATSNLRNASVEQRTQIITELIKDPDVRTTIREVIVNHERSGPRERPVPVRTLNDQWHDWLNAANTLFTNGARLATATDNETVDLDAHAAAARILYDRLVERQIDAEIRSFMDAEVR